MSLRFKIVFAILAAAFISVALVLMPMLVGVQNLIDKGAERELDSFEERLNLAVDAKVSEAAAMAALVAGMPRVGQAMARGDRAVLEASFVPGFARMRRQHEIGQFQFHTPEAHSFFRVHKPEKFGDDLSGFRKTVVEANKARHAVAGLERGRAGLGVRGIAPVLNGVRHVGSVEIGLALGQEFFDGLRGESGVELEFYVLPDESVEGFDASSARVTRVVGSLSEANPLPAAQLYEGAEEARTLGYRDLDGDRYAAALFPVRDFSGEVAGVVHAMVPIAAFEVIASEMRVIALAGGAFALIFGAAMAWVFGGRIVKTMLRLIGQLKSLAGGNAGTALDPPGAYAGEMALLAEGLDIFRDKLVETRALHNENAAREAQQARVVEELAKGLERLSQGDLTARIEADLGEGYRQLAEDFNTATESLAEVVSSIAESSGAISAVVTEIRSAAHDLSHRTEKSAATLEESSAALREMTDSVALTAAGAREADDIGRDAIGKAKSGEAVVTETISAMREIEESAARISGIVDMIEDIAFQTNLLALNAGVEAARAGAAGSGFAVVAVEVRELAAKTAQAANEIGSLIETSGAKVEQGVGLVGKTGTALAEIVAAAESLTGKISDMAGLASGQSTGLAEINAAVEQLDRTTQQNAAMFEETTTAHDTLTEEGERLHQLVQRFRHNSAESTGAGVPALDRPGVDEDACGGEDAAATAVRDTGWEEFAATG